MAITKYKIGDMVRDSRGRVWKVAKVVENKYSTEDSTYFAEDRLVYAYERSLDLFSASTTPVATITPSAPPVNPTYPMGANPHVMVRPNTPAFQKPNINGVNA